MYLLYNLKESYHTFATAWTVIKFFLHLMLDNLDIDYCRNIFVQVQMPGHDTI